MKVEYILRKNNIPSKIFEIPLEKKTDVYNTCN